MMLNSGLQASVFAQGWPGSTGTAAIASAQAPRTIGQQAYGVVSGDTSGPRTAGYAILGGGALALGLLAYIWWSLPR